jgi:hypothetical protein
MGPQDCYNRLLARQVIGELEKHNIGGYYCDTREDALQKALEMIPPGSTVSCGGSATLREIRLHEALGAGNYRYLDPLGAKGGQEKERIAHEALAADWYLMSANAISATGELVNIDGIGNRGAALCFGPGHVLVIAGMNKVEPDLEAAICRAKKRAAPMVLLLWSQDYASFDALSKAAGEACGQMVITRMAVAKGRISVILVGEPLGF